MAEQIKVEEEYQEGSSKFKKVYTFYMFDLRAVFVGYELSEKAKGKRKFLTKEKWDKYSTRKSNIEEPELSENIEAKVIEEIVNSVQVMTWDEFKK